MTRLQMLALSVAVMALAPMAAHANSAQREGWYVGGAGMMSSQEDGDSSVQSVEDHLKYNLGWGVSGSAGYAYGNGWRAEGEVAYRRSDIDTVEGVNAGPNNGGSISNTSFMANGLYDFDTGTDFTPYLGAGVGFALVGADNIRTVNGFTADSQPVEFAYQFIGGVSMDLDKDWAVTADYRFYKTLDVGFETNGGGNANTENASHNLLVGVRYALGGEEYTPPAPQPMAQPAPVVIPQPQMAERPVVPAVPQSYMVFFDFDRSELTPEAQRIIAAAAKDYKNGRYIRIVVTGHTDTMGSVQYNQRLSERRAASVAKEFMHLGVPSDEISMTGAGKSRLLVPTNDQVREAQNRRAEIVFNK